MSELARVAGDSTPARLFLGSAGVALPTSEMLRLRADHAAARDAVAADLDPNGSLASTIAALGGLTVETCASSPSEHLLRPDLGRRFSDDGVAMLRAQLPGRVDVQVIVGDGLSAGAVEDGAAEILVGLQRAFDERGLTTAPPLLVRHCRVGVMNHLGDLTEPEVVILLIGERPGLATNRSMSAYLAFRPRSGCTDADRNCISNIHREGVSTHDATARITALVEEFQRVGASGVAVKER